MMWSATTYRTAHSAFCAHRWVMLQLLPECLSGVAGDSDWPLIRHVFFSVSHERSFFLMF